MKWDIMLSYQWDSQKYVIRVRDSLVKAGMNELIVLFCISMNVCQGTLMFLLGLTPR